MNRLVPNLSRAEYDKLSFDNWSSIRRIADSPAHYKWAKDHPEEDDDTDARKFGRAAHLAILEPEKFEASVAHWAGGRRAGKEWDAFRASNAGKEIVTSDELNRLSCVRDAVQRCDYAKRLVSGGQSEVTMLWETEVIPGFPVPCRGRLDYLPADCIVDLKLTRCASPEAFGRQAWDSGYLGQAAFYGDGYARITGERRRFFFLAVENVAPFNVGVYEVTPEQMAAGRAEYERLLSILSVCRIEGKWPGYSTAPMPLALPAWATKQAEQAMAAEAAWDSNQEAQHG